MISGRVILVPNLLAHSCQVQDFGRRYGRDCDSTRVDHVQATLIIPTVPEVWSPYPSSAHVRIRRLQGIIKADRNQGIHFELKASIPFKLPYAVICDVNEQRLRYTLGQRRIYIRTSF